MSCLQKDMEKEGDMWHNDDIKFATRYERSSR